MTLRSRLLALPLLTVSLWCGTACARYEPDVWLQEFTKLRADMAAHYANLDWMVAYRKVDLKALTQQTEDALRTARSEGQARKALLPLRKASSATRLSLLEAALTPVIAPQEAPRIP